MWVIRRLRAAGHQALLAGGCVRDMLLGLPCTDYDVATDATPSHVRRLFPRVLLVGAKFGVAMVLHRGRKVEVTTFRSDLSYSDGRRPDGVRFATPREDAQRRDFTINGMFHDPLGGRVIDYVGGRRDLRRRIIRTIGDPRLRFAEDYLRLIRAVRFAVRLDFAIDPATARAARELAERITSISGERVFDELSKMLCHPGAAEALEKLHELDLARHVLPELFAAEGTWPAAVRRVRAVAAGRDGRLCFAALLADLDPPIIRRIARRWGASNDLADGLGFLALHAHAWPDAADLPLCDFKRLMAHEDFPRLRTLWAVEERTRTGQRRHSRRIARRAGGIQPDQVRPAPLVTGEDLKRLGVPEGPALGRILRALYDGQLNEEIPTRPAALARARELAGGT